MRILCILLTVYLVVLLASVVLSWVALIRPLPSGPARRVIDAIFAVTTPVFRLVRGVLPPIRMGGAALDLSPMIVFIVLSIVSGFVCRLG